MNPMNLKSKSQSKSLAFVLVLALSLQPVLPTPLSLAAGPVMPGSSTSDFRTLTREAQPPSSASHSVTSTGRPSSTSSSDLGQAVNLTASQRNQLDPLRNRNRRPPGVSSASSGPATISAHGTRPSDSTSSHSNETGAVHCFSFANHWSTGSSAVPCPGLSPNNVNESLQRIYGRILHVSPNRIIGVVQSSNCPKSMPKCTDAGITTVWVKDNEPTTSTNAAGTQSVAISNARGKVQIGGVVLPVNGILSQHTLVKSMTANITGERAVSAGVYYELGYGQSAGQLQGPFAEAPILGGTYTASAFSFPQPMGYQGSDPLRFFIQAFDIDGKIVATQEVQIDWERVPGRRVFAAAPNPAPQSTVKVSNIQATATGGAHPTLGG